MVRALSWSFLSEVSARAIQPIVFVVLARFVVPEDFGVMAAALMTIAFSQVLWEAGLGKAIVQRRDDVTQAASVALWMNLALGLVVALVLLSGAGAIATLLFRDPRVAPVLRVLSAQVLLGAAGSVHVALLQRALAFKKLFWVRLTTAVLPGLASVPLAWLGLGYWALVAGALLAQAAQLVVLWTSSGWRPSLTFDRRLAVQLVRFGAWVELSGLLGWFYAWGDAFVVGVHLGSHELGLYRVGGQLAATIFALVLGPVSPVLYSLLCRMNGDLAALRVAADRIVATLSLVAVPMAVAMAALASPLAAALFGDRWRGVDQIIAIMCLMHGFSWIVGMNGEIYRASGKPAFEPIVTAVMLPIYLAGYLLSARLGLDAFLRTRLLLALVALVAHLAVLRWLVGSPLVSPLIRASLVALAVGVPAHWIVTVTSPWLHSPWAHLMVAGTLVAGVVAAVVLFAGGRRRFREFVQLGRDTVSAA